MASLLYYFLWVFPCYFLLFIIVLIYYKLLYRVVFIKETC